jgi:phosphatidylserine decarboxylase
MMACHLRRDPSVAVCGSDSRVLVFEDVPQAKSLWIKGTDFSIQKLIGSRWVYR